ncbi:MTH1187 family thiamine-binding protein [Candidatus Nitrosotenuis chungbukensis]|uniref:MTH1187 family thiamine-binding protein n=1 Tax=Candidatus Nitrosotenuis chungbukensis TaxID=1353246 RepID=UPI0005B2C07C|nr:MTH1187 family thiamine-binding protein [Candidatus Nitrosotenuis chungbukensis]WKT57417.1 MTH1187 family thiamine-binding protein [Candidatus Nitrosotenuis chungbukensis]
MIHAEISIYPIGTDSTSVSIYVARAIEAIADFKDVKYKITPMGTVLESDRIERIFEATKIMTDAVHRMGVKRVEVILKIDSRSDKNQTIDSKVDSVNKYLKSEGP